MLLVRPLKLSIFGCYVLMLAGTAAVEQISFLKELETSHTYFCLLLILTGESMHAVL